MENNSVNFDLTAHHENSKNFLIRAGYSIVEPEYVGFCMPHIHAEKMEGKKIPRKYSQGWRDKHKDETKKGN